MKRYVLLITLLFNCASVQKETLIEDTPQWATACSTYEGIAWERCMIKLVNKLGNITAVPPTREIIEKKRINEDEVIYYSRVCFGNEDFCVILPDKKNEPTVWAKVKPHLITGGGFFIIGLIGGISASN